METQRELDRWFEHLTQADLSVLHGAATAAGEEPDSLATDANALARVLGHRATWEAISAEGEETEQLLPASPFLTFAVIVHRGQAELQDATYVEEWVGMRQRLPVLGGDDLRDFFGDAQRRLLLTELLTSYTRVVSGSVWERTGRGWRRRRFSELDPVRLASLLESVQPQERTGVFRRLGDLALFLTGVFPDHTERGIGDIAAARLIRMSGLSEAGDDLADAGGVALLEQLGARWYRAAVRTAPHPSTADLQLVAEIGDHFVVARRALNYLTDRYLFPHRHGWFGMPAA